MQPNGRTHAITLDQKTAAQSLSLQWHTDTLVATAQPRELFGEDGYVIRVDGHQGNVVRTFTLHRKTKREDPQDDAAIWIEGDTIVAPGHARGGVDFWNYPQGGEPERRARAAGVEEYFTSMVVSPAR